MSKNNIIIPEHTNIVIKGKFKFVNKNIYGLFAILVDLKAKKVINSWVFASYFQDIQDHSIHMSWKEFEAILNNLQMSGSFAESITISLRKSIHEYLIRDNNISLLLVDDLIRNNPKEIKKTVLSIFHHAEKKNTINLDLAYESVDLSIPKDNPKIEKKKDEDNERLEIQNSMEVLSNSEVSKIAPQGTYIPAHPVLAPFYQGILSHKLKVGNKILMNIDDSTEYGKQCADIFDVYDKESIKRKINPIIASVIKINKQHGNNTLDIVVSYNQTYYTKFNIEEGVKIKFYDPIAPDKIIDPLKSSTLEENILDLEDGHMQKLMMDPQFVKMLIIIALCLMATIFGILLV
ncbi:MAG: hypothetical protein ACRCTJ_06305 [Brevinema sp.]